MTTTGAEKSAQASAIDQLRKKGITLQATEDPDISLYLSPRNQTHVDKIKRLIKFQKSPAGRQAISKLKLPEMQSKLLLPLPLHSHENENGALLQQNSISVMMKGTPSLRGGLGAERVGANGKILTPSGSVETPTALQIVSDMGNTPDCSDHLKWQRSVNPSRSLYQNKKKKREANQDLIDNILHTLGEDLTSVEHPPAAKGADRGNSTRLRIEQVVEEDSQEIRRKEGERLEMQLRTELLGSIIPDRAPLTPSLPVKPLMTAPRTPGNFPKDDESPSASASGSFGHFNVKGKLIQKLSESRRDNRRPLSSLPEGVDKRTKGADVRRPDSPLQTFAAREDPRASRESPYGKIHDTVTLADEGSAHKLPGNIQTPNRPVGEISHSNLSQDILERMLPKNTLADLRGHESRVTVEGIRIMYAPDGSVAKVEDDEKSVDDGLRHVSQPRRAYAGLRRARHSSAMKGHDRRPITELEAKALLDVQALAAEKANQQSPRLQRRMSPLATPNMLYQMSALQPVMYQTVRQNRGVKLDERIASLPGSRSSGGTCRTHERRVSFADLQSQQMSQKSVLRGDAQLIDNAVRALPDRGRSVAVNIPFDGYDLSHGDLEYFDSLINWHKPKIREPAQVRTQDHKDRINHALELVNTQMSLEKNIQQMQKYLVQRIVLQKEANPAPTIEGHSQETSNDQLSEGPHLLDQTLPRMPVTQARANIRDPSKSKSPENSMDPQASASKGDRTKITGEKSATMESNAVKDLDASKSKSESPTPIIKHIYDGDGSRDDLDPAVPQVENAVDNGTPNQISVKLKVLETQSNVPAYDVVSKQDIMLNEDDLKDNRGKSRKKQSKSVLKEGSRPSGTSSGKHSPKKTLQLPNLEELSRLRQMKNQRRQQVVKKGSGIPQNVALKEIHGSPSFHLSPRGSGTLISRDGKHSDLHDSQLPLGNSMNETVRSGLNAKSPFQRARNTLPVNQWQAAGSRTLTSSTLMTINAMKGTGNRHFIYKYVPDRLAREAIMFAENRTALKADIVAKTKSRASSNCQTATPHRGQSAQGVAEGWVEQLKDASFGDGDARPKEPSSAEPKIISGDLDQRCQKISSKTKQRLTSGRTKTMDQVYLSESIYGSKRKARGGATGMPNDLGHLGKDLQITPSELKTRLRPADHTRSNDLEQYIPSQSSQPIVADSVLSEATGTPGSKHVFAAVPSGLIQGRRIFDTLQPLNLLRQSKNRSTVNRHDASDDLTPPDPDKGDHTQEGHSKITTSLQIASQVGSPNIDETQNVSHDNVTPSPDVPAVRVFDEGIISEHDSVAVADETPTLVPIKQVVGAATRTRIYEKFNINQLSSLKPHDSKEGLRIKMAKESARRAVTGLVQGEDASVPTSTSPITSDRSAFFHAHWSEATMSHQDTGSFPRVPAGGSQTQQSHQYRMVEQRKYGSMASEMTSRGVARKFGAAKNSLPAIPSTRRPSRLGVQLGPLTAMRPAEVHDLQIGFADMALTSSVFSGEGTPMDARYQGSPLASSRAPVRTPQSIADVNQKISALAKRNRALKGRPSPSYIMPAPHRRHFQLKDPVSFVPLNQQQNQSQMYAAGYGIKRHEPYKQHVWTLQSPMQEQQVTYDMRNSRAELSSNRSSLLEDHSPQSPRSIVRGGDREMQTQTSAARAIQLYEGSNQDLQNVIGDLGSAEREAEALRDIQAKEQELAAAAQATTIQVMRNADSKSKVNPFKESITNLAMGGANSFSQGLQAAMGEEIISAIQREHLLRLQQASDMQLVGQAFGQLKPQIGPSLIEQLQLHSLLSAARSKSSEGKGSSRSRKSQQEDILRSREELIQRTQKRVLAAASKEAILPMPKRNSDQSRNHGGIGGPSTGLHFPSAETFNAMRHHSQRVSQAGMSDQDDGTLERKVQHIDANAPGMDSRMRGPADISPVTTQYLLSQQELTGPLEKSKEMASSRRKTEKPVLQPRDKKDNTSSNAGNTVSPVRGLSRNTTTLNQPSTKTLNVRSADAQSRRSRRLHGCPVTPEESAETPAHMAKIEAQRYESIQIIDQGQAPFTGRRSSQQKKKESFQNLENIYGNFRLGMPINSSIKKSQLSATELTSSFQGTGPLKGRQHHSSSNAQIVYQNVQKKSSNPTPEISDGHHARQHVHARSNPSMDSVSNSKQNENVPPSRLKLQAKLQSGSKFGEQSSLSSKQFSTGQLHEVAQQDIDDENEDCN